LNHDCLIGASAAPAQVDPAQASERAADYDTTVSVTLPGLAAMLPAARRLVRGSLDSLPRAADLELIASELITSRIRYSSVGDPGGQFTLTVRRAPGRARVEVSDTTSIGWQPGPCGDDDADGPWSDMILYALADNLGRDGIIHYSSGSHSRTSWAETRW
jgi:hypothetical protein